MRDRPIGISDLNQLRLWIESNPEVPGGDWYKDLGSFKICGRGAYPKTFLLRGQVGRGRIRLAFIAVPMLLNVVVLFAMWLPTRRATRVDPVVALRYE